MTDDLVKRLREVEQYPDPMLRGRIKDAADRIEQQERYLAEAQKCLDAGDYEGAVIICRTALGEKNGKDAT